MNFLSAQHEPDTSLAFWRNELGIRILVLILVFSSFVTLALTAFDLYFDYKTDETGLRSRLDETIQGYSASLGEGLWNLDKRQLTLQIEGISRLPDIQLVDLFETDPNGSLNLIASVGHRPASSPVTRDIPLFCACDGNNKRIGTLHIEATMSNIYDRLFTRAAIVFVSHAVRTAITALFILFILHRLIARHLHDITAQISHPMIAAAGIRLKRKTPSKPDELDLMVRQLNTWQAQLRETASRFKGIVDNLPGITFQILCTPTETKTLYMSEGSERITGLLPSHWMDNPDEREYFPDIYQALQKSDRCDTVARLIRPDGTGYWGMFHRQVAERRGDGIVVNCLLLDITAEMEAKLALEAHEAEIRNAATKMQTILDNIPDLAWVKDKDGRFVAANEALIRELGLSRQDQIIGKTDLDVNPMAFAMGYRNDDSDVMAAGVRKQICERHTRLDGSVIWIDTIKTPLFDGNGAVVGTAGIARDVSGRQQTEDSLRETSTLLTSLTDNIPGYLYRMKMDRNYNITILYCSAGIERVTGTKVESFMTMNQEQLQSYIVEEDRDTVIQEMSRQWAENGGGDIRYRVDADNGKRLWLLNHSHVVAHEVDGLLIDTLIFDVTAETLAAQALERKSWTLGVHAAAGTAISLAKSDAELYDKLCQSMTSLPFFPLAAIGFADDGPDSSIKIMGKAGPASAFFDRASFSWSLERDDGRGAAGTCIRTGQQQIIAINTPRVYGGYAETAKDLGLLSACFIPLKNDVKTFGVLMIFCTLSDFEDTGLTESLGHLGSHLSRGLTAYVNKQKQEEASAEFHTALAEREANFRLVIAAMVEGVMFQSADGQITGANAEAERILGHTEAQLKTMSRSVLPWIFTFEDGKVMAVEDYPSHRCLQTGLPQRDIVMGILHPGQNIRWLSVNAHPMNQPGNTKPNSVVITFHEITERKNHEEMLERFNRLLQTLADCNEVLARANDETEMYSKICDTLVESGGYRMAWIGQVEHDKLKTVRPLAHAGHEDGYLNAFSVSWDETLPNGRGPVGIAIRSGHPSVINDYANFPITQALRHMGLERGYNSILALPLKSESGILGSLAIYSSRTNAFTDEMELLIDLSNNVAFAVAALRERKAREAMETQLRQAQKLEALGQLSGNIAHDFNNLLGAILGFANFIMEDAKDDQTITYHASRILAAGRRGKTLIEQIRSFSRQEEMQRIPVSPAETVREAMSILQGSIPESTVISVGAIAESAHVVGDPNQLIQVLINLCINAHDALNGAAGTIKISVAPTVLAEGDALERLSKRRVTDANFVESWTDDRGENWAVFGMLDPTCSYVSMIVEDSGCGMELGLLQNIFTPFFTTKGKTHGTGLGLAVVQGIVLAHVGAMVVQSRPGKGTRIKVILPLQKEEALSRSRKRRLIQAPTPEAERRTAAPQSNSGTKVLLVDDDPDFGDMLLTALERRGFEVAPCTSPVEALEEFLQNQRAWDVVVTDQTMPEMEGLELIRAIRKVNPNMPCILCTGFAETQVSLDVLNDSGAFALLRKPIDIDALTEAIRAALKDKAVTSP